ncbi:LNS2 (Lipin/Ned1/Smp2) protein [Besnoitia besnoiti]|uniref:LNS2 (Lipin/Ned1/Smp2) protein n=1 Tax=Besnoitia besnoiti TaxID=94643 RepID=A0A2A9MJI6_BESBE|nr:LNS2 (Lipin/Ned1/Smp2) protein [Besnoitia besnoiti]PFH38708.1 LNS2 (Lipin/Ned1/Smp2) protein [Besnoitia besnoiti]
MRCPCSRYGGCALLMFCVGCVSLRVFQYNSFNFWSLSIVDFPSDEDEEDEESVAGLAVSPLHQPSLQLSPAPATAETAAVASVNAASAALLALDVAAVAGPEAAGAEPGLVETEQERGDAVAFEGARRAPSAAAVAAALSLAVSRETADEEPASDEGPLGGYETPQLDGLPPGQCADERGEADELARDVEKSVSEGESWSPAEDEREPVEHAPLVRASQKAELGGTQDSGVPRPGPRRRAPCAQPRRLSATGDPLATEEVQADSASETRGAAAVSSTCPSGGVGGACDVCGRRFGGASRRRRSFREAAVPARREAKPRRRHSEANWRVRGEEDSERLCEDCRGLFLHPGNGADAWWQIEGGCLRERAGGESESQTDVGKRAAAGTRVSPRTGGICCPGEETGAAPEGLDSGPRAVASPSNREEDAAEVDGRAVSHASWGVENAKEADSPTPAHSSQRVLTYISLDSDADIWDCTARSRLPEELSTSPAKARRAIGASRQAEEALLMAAAFAVDAATSHDASSEGQLSGARQTEGLTEAQEGNVAVSSTASPSEATAVEKNEAERASSAQAAEAAEGEAAEKIGPRAASSSSLTGSPLCPQSSASSEFSSISDDGGNHLPQAKAGPASAFMRRADSEPGTRRTSSVPDRRAHDAQTGVEQSEAGQHASAHAPRQPGVDGAAPGAGSPSADRETGPVKVALLFESGGISVPPFAQERVPEGRRRRGRGSGGNGRREASGRAPEEGSDDTAADAAQTACGMSEASSRSPSRGAENLRTQGSFRSVDDPGENERDAGKGRKRDV